MRLRIKPLALASGRFIAATPERAFMSVWKWTLHTGDCYKTVTVSVLVSAPKRPRSGRFNSEATVRLLQKLSHRLDSEVV
jgi:hypothetical protein